MPPPIANTPSIYPQSQLRLDRIRWTVIRSFHVETYQEYPLPAGKPRLLIQMPKTKTVISGLSSSLAAIMNNHLTSRMP